MLLAMYLSPDMQWFLAGRLTTAAFTPTDFSMLDRVPAKQHPTTLAVEEEDAMAVRKPAA